ncbi:hypothetical protein HSIEG1_802 [Enterococcus sp. HSIEG1]|nr:hypothetical protein HSIEG1_802 [Enterococcus sp. HSIEG1]
MFKFISSKINNFTLISFYQMQIKVQVRGAMSQKSKNGALTFVKSMRAIATKAK